MAFPTIPIDIRAVLEASGMVSGERDEKINIAVFVDESADPALVSHTKNAFFPVTHNALLHIEAFYDVALEVDSAADVAIIVAGTSPAVGATAAFSRALGIPAVVVTCDPITAAKRSREAGCPLVSTDIISPQMAYYQKNVVATAGKAAREAADTIDTTSGYTQKGVKAVAVKVGSSAGSLAASPRAPWNRARERKAELVTAAGDIPTVAPDSNTIDFTVLFNALGTWIVRHCQARRLALAHAFPFIRRPLAHELTHATAFQNAAVGAVVFIPGADMPVMTLNQAKMLLQVAAAYGQPLGMERVKELAVVVGGAFALRTVARQLVGVVPALGWAVKAAIGYSGTLAMGYAATEYFEKGGNFSGLAATVSKARDKAVRKARVADEGK